MLEGVPERLSVIRETVPARVTVWAMAVGSIVLDLATLQEPEQDRVVIVVALSLATLLVYGVIRLLIGRGMRNERMHVVVVQLAGFLVLFLGTVAVFAFARALTDRSFAATMAMFHASWALGAVDGYRWGRRRTEPRVLSSERTTTIFVNLPEEGTDVWRPVEAEHLRDDLYRIVSQRDVEDEVWEFDTGAVVRCRLRQLGGEEALVAIAAAGDAG